jgi:hypothetical protein
MQYPAFPVVVAHKPSSPLLFKHVTSVTPQSSTPAWQSLAS